MALAQTTTAFRRAAVGLVRSSSKWHVPGSTAILGSLLGRRWGTFDAESNRKDHVVIALGGNALLKRGQEMTMANQRQNIRQGMKSLKEIFDKYKVTMVHGNGPQVGLLVLESAAYEKQTGLQQMELDVLDAETEGMIGYLLEQEIRAHIDPTKRGLCTILSQILVDPDDPAFDNPTKFIGPVYTREEAMTLGLPVRQDGDHWRRVVPSPLPVRLLENQMHAVKLLTDSDCIVICAGGGGIPVIENKETKELEGVEAVIDKDRAACMMGAALGAQGLLILTDVPAVALNYKEENQRWIRSVSPAALTKLMDQFPAGSMGPKIESAIDFVQKTKGWAAIGSLNEADLIVAGEAGTRIEERDEEDFIEFHGDDMSNKSVA